MNQTGKKKQVREPPSVPFLWEVKPGIAKKGREPEISFSSVSQVSKSPLKLIASVPFVWEEKPGKRLPNFFAGFAKSMEKMGRIRQLLQGSLENLFAEFAKSVEKMGRTNVKTGTKGEIRKQCAVVNS